MKKFYSLFILSLAFIAMQAQTDVTSYLPQADMEDDTHTLAAWTTNMVPQYNGKSGYSAYAGFTESFMETWTGSYNTTDGTQAEDGNYYLHEHYAYQDTIIPNGTYLLSAWIIATQQSFSSEEVLEKTKGVYLFANNDSIEVVTYNLTPTQFSMFTNVTDGNLRAGIYIKEGTTANWVAWDNVSLTYYEGLSLLGGELQALIDKVSAGMGEFTVIQGSIQNELESALDDADPTVDDATIQAAITRLANAYDVAIASNDAYSALAVAIDSANSNYYAAGLGANLLEEAISAAETMYNNAESSTAAVKAQTATLVTALADFKTKNAGEDNPQNYTEFITNAALQTATTGWTTSVGTASFEYNVCEFYNQDFNISQTIKGLPNGHYKVTVQGFYREAGNDSGAAYAAGTENIIAYLFANNKQTKMLSLYAHTASEMGITNDQVLNDYVNMRVSTDEAFTNGYYKENSLDVIVLDSTLTIGVKGEGHQGSSWCTMRNFTLTYYGFDIATTLMSLQDEVLAFEEANYNDDPYQSNLLLGIYYSLDDALQESYNYLSDTKDVIKDVYANLDSIYKMAQESMTAFTAYKNLLAQAADLIANTTYPGKLALNIANNKAKNYLADEFGTIEGLNEQKTALRKAIITYQFSQAASMDAPINVSFIIQNRSFRVDQEDDSITATRTSIGWTHAESVYKDGDYTTYYSMGRTCWNSWSVNFTSMDVHQDLTDLPAGIYSLKCSAITQANCLNDQHSYIKSDIMKSVSPYMTIVGWDTSGTHVGGSGTDGNGIWEEMPTNKVLLTSSDSILRIGFASTHDTSSSTAENGWFCVTDFELWYYGSDDSGLYNDYVDVIDGLKSDMILKADIAAVDEFVAAAGAATTTAEKYTAIGQAIDLANASISGYAAFSEGAYTNFASSIENAVSDYGKNIGGATIDLIDNLLEAGDATYTILDSISTLLNAYTDYITAVEKAAESLEVADNAYTAKLEGILTAQQTALSGSLANEQTLAEYTKTLTYASADIQLSLIVEGAGNEDISFLIVNPELATTDNGWNVEYGTVAWGYNVAEFYNETFNMSQTLMVPNGNYTVSVYGYNRPGANSAATMQAASVATFYANKVESPMLSVYSTYFEEALVTGNDYEVVEYNEDSTEVTYKYYPNNLQGAGSALIDRGCYLNNITVDVTDHLLTVGLKQTVGVAQSWTAFCNFSIWLNTLGDNQDWVIDTKVDTKNIAPAVQVIDGKIVVNSDQPYRIYSIDGKEMSGENRLSKGIYLVRCGKYSTKVLVNAK